MGKLTRKLIIAGSVVLLAGGGLYWAREHFGGFRHLFGNIEDKLAGKDMYDAKESIFKRGNRDYPDLLLTIDDGPHPESLPRILDTLKQYHVHATFFLVGKMVKKHPDLVRRIIAEGHEIGNHTQDHIRLDTLNEKQIRAELINCELNIAQACGRSTHLMRPPGMRFNPTVLKVVHEMGYTCVDWNIAAKDFVPPTDSKEAGTAGRATFNMDPQLVVDRVVERVKNGEIILLHDIPVTADALPMILEQLQTKGYTFKSTAQMLAELPTPVTLVANPQAKNVVLTAQKNPHTINPTTPKRAVGVR